MWAFLTEVIRKTLAGFGERMAAFGPNILAMLVILVAGMLVAASLHLAFRLALPRLGFDRFAERLGLEMILRKGGITRSPSAAVALAVAWASLAIFVLLAIGALDLQFAMDLVSRTFTYLPQVLIA